MPINVLFAASADNWYNYETPLREALTSCGLSAHLSREIAPEEVDYIIYAPTRELQDFTPYTRAKAVLSLWAGVEKIVSNDTLRMPLARMVDPGLTRGMVEWVVGHVMRHHLGMDRDILNTNADWLYRTPPLAQERRVVILGLGALGQAAANSLSGLGFDVSGWSRSPKKIDNIHCFHGKDGLHTALARAEILVTLLPDTPATANTINAETLSLMPHGAFIINPGRGTLIDDNALLAALDNGQIAHATLDVFRVEPLPKDHPYWAHPHVTVTPHIAAETRASTASQVIAENILRCEKGQDLLHLVDRTLGY